MNKMSYLPHFINLLILASLVILCQSACDQCYKPHLNQKCSKKQGDIDFHTLHMSVHPHLDAFWIFDFQSYYDPKPNEGNVFGYFSSNRFNSVKQIFNTITSVLTQSKEFRQKNGLGSQKAHRSFFNSEMGFFKRWYFEQTPENKDKVKSLLKTKYWEILGGGVVEHDEGCAYYDDIIESYQIGLRFLKQQFNYHPKVAISADSFGHSQTTLAILAHLGIEGYFVERSDQHILLENKTQFIWKAQSANGHFYGALPTHIRWAIHGFEDQFIGSNPNEKMCRSKQSYINNLRRQNEFLKRILKSNHIMRYFGHDFQQFDNYSYSVIEGMMEQFSKEKCNKVIALYGNPTEYFKTLMGEVWGKKVKPIAIRTEDIMPIWDYDSGLYWTGYYTTDPFHKKNYRDAGRMLHCLRKAFLPAYIDNKTSGADTHNYNKLEQLAQQVSFAQHHDGISGTSKYTVMDTLEIRLEKHINGVKDNILNQMFETSFPINTHNPIFNCSLQNICQIPPKLNSNVYLKVFNSAGDRKGQPLKLKLPYNQYYKPDCQYQINCMCQKLPCDCTLYLYPRLFTYTPIMLKKATIGQIKVNKLESLKEQKNYSYNLTHFTIEYNGKKYSIGYKAVIAQRTERSYPHLSRYGDFISKSFSINSGKYALGNNPNKIKDLSTIKSVYKLQSPKLTIIVIRWKREQMKTIITIRKDLQNQWKVQTFSAAPGRILQDLYFEVGTEINNQKKFFTDSNGWLVMERTLFHHEDYQAFFSPSKYDDINGNSYPMTAFTYIQDDKDKVSVNTDRAQGVIAYLPGKLWINFDRLSSDDGKWVYEDTYRHQYQRFTHVITVDNKNYNQRKIQTLYDQPIIMQGNSVQPNERIEQSNFNFQLRDRWAKLAGIDGVKFFVKPWNDSTVTVRIHNLHDENSKVIGLYANNSSPFLTTFFGNQVKFKSIEESSLGGNMQYEQFLKQKWNWNNVINLTIQNNIFNKDLQENITLRPLEIRTFTFKGLSIVMDCQEPEKLLYNSIKLQQRIVSTALMPKRQQSCLDLEKRVGQYLLNGDHCNDPSPILINYKDEPKYQPKTEPKVQPGKTETKSNPKVQPQPKHRDQIQDLQQKQSVTFEEIQKKVQNLFRLSRNEKIIYFSKRLEQIKLMKNI